MKSINMLYVMGLVCLLGMDPMRAMYGPHSSASSSSLSSSSSASSSAGSSSAAPHMFTTTARARNKKAPQASSKRHRGSDSASKRTLKRSSLSGKSEGGAGEGGADVVDDTSLASVTFNLRDSQVVEGEEESQVCDSGESDGEPGSGGALGRIRGKDNEGEEEGLGERSSEQFGYSYSGKEAKEEAAEMRGADSGFGTFSHLSDSDGPGGTGQISVNTWIAPNQRKKVESPSTVLRGLGFVVDEQPTIQHAPQPRQQASGADNSEEDNDVASLVGRARKGALGQQLDPIHNRHKKTHAAAPTEHPSSSAGAPHHRADDDNEEEVVLPPRASSFRMTSSVIAKSDPLFSFNRLSTLYALWYMVRTAHAVTVGGTGRSALSLIPIMGDATDIYMFATNNRIPLFVPEYLKKMSLSSAAAGSLAVGLSWLVVSSTAGDLMSNSNRSKPHKERKETALPGLVWPAALVTVQLLAHNRLLSTTGRGLNIIDGPLLPKVALGAASCVGMYRYMKPPSEAK